MHSYWLAAVPHMCTLLIILSHPARLSPLESFCEKMLVYSHLHQYCKWYLILLSQNFLISSELKYHIFLKTTYK